MSQTSIRKALQEVADRRIHAQEEQEQRCQKIEKEIPEIAEINRTLFETTFRIMQGEDINLIKKQNFQAQQHCAHYLAKHNYPTDYLDVHYSCPKCNDTGYVENGLYCDCVLKLASHYAVAEMNEKAQIRLSTFEQFSLRYYQEPGATKYFSYVQSVLRFCQEYARDFSLRSPSLLFWGKAGTGKTHLSLAIVTEVLAKGYNVIYDSIGNLLSRIESDHFKNNADPEKDTLQVLLNADLLVMDDLGTEFQSSFSLATIYTIVNTRLNRNLPTIISTNLDLSEDELTTSYKNRIASRLMSCYKTVQFVGVDVRQKQEEMNPSNLSYYE